MNVNDVTIVVPTAYTSVFNIYSNFLDYNELQYVDNDSKQCVLTVDTLLLCFNMESFFIDYMFFNYLICKSYSVWNDFHPHIHALPDSKTVYLHCSHKFIPVEYINDPTFFNMWIDINQK